MVVSVRSHGMPRGYRVGGLLGPGLGCHHWIEPLQLPPQARGEDFGLEFGLEAVGHGGTRGDIENI